MIVDSSALVAILRQEPDAEALENAMLDAQRLRISAVTFVEAAVVIDGARDAVATRRFNEFIEKMQIEIEPVTADLARIAREAYRDFGKGTGHPAKLNLGDCFSYALARSTGDTLLFKGGDFVHTGIKSALKTTTLQEPPSPTYGELWD